MLENEDADSSFGPQSPAPYLSKTLRAEGAFVPNFYATGHLSLDNYISMISGQAPNPVTQADAPAYVDFVPGTPASDGQYIGSGSVYPPQVKTIADQLDAKGLTWGGYMEDMGNTPTAPKTCRHPAIGATDDTQQARATDQYATRHNPFVYFHSIIDDQARCDAHDVPLDRLPAALSGTTPNYVFITPNLCHDGHDEPCANGEPGGMVSADAFLKEWIPKIRASRAFQDGLVIVTFDEAENHDATACCNEQPGPNTPNPGGPTPGPGGGRIGAVLLSPYIKPGTVTQTAYNHYSALRSVEDIFGLEHLGYAGQEGLVAFGSDVYTQPDGIPSGPRSKVRVTLSGVPRHCGRGRFRARVGASGPSGLTVEALLDGKHVKSSSKQSFGATVDCSKLSRGVHRFTASAAFGGRSAHRVIHFRKR